MQKDDFLKHRTMREYKMLFYVLVTRLLTTMTEAQDPVTSDRSPPITETRGPTLSPTINSGQTTLEQVTTTLEQVITRSLPTTQLPTKAQRAMTNPPTTAQVTPTAKFSTATEIKTEKLPTESVTTKSADRIPLKTTTQLTPTTAQVTPTAKFSNATEIKTMESVTTKSANRIPTQFTSNAQKVTTNPPTTKQEAKMHTTTKKSEKLTTKPVKMNTTTDFGTQSTTSAQKVVSEKSTSSLPPIGKLSATTQITTKKDDAQSATTPKVQKPTTKLTTTKKPSVITKVRTTTSPVYDKNGKERAQKQGKIVAGIIGGALLAMMVGFVVILYKKHKLKKHQIATTDWAGPTPFLETGSENNGDVTLRSSHRISLTSFLPQRLSKRLSLLGESREELQEMEEMMTPSTFGGKEEKNVKENGPSVTKTETAEMNKLEKSEVDITEKSANETTENKSEISTKTDDVVVFNEMDKNGEIKNKDGQTENAKVEKEEDKESENNPAEPATAENPPKDTNNENKGDTGKDEADNVV